MNYIQKLKFNCPTLVAGNEIDMAVPHQSISPREILDSWVKNDMDTDVHQPVEDWNGGNVHPNSIREFEDNFEAMEYIADMINSPVTLKDVGQKVPLDPKIDEPKPADSNPADPKPAE